MEVELWIEDLYQLVQCRELRPHAALISHEVSRHPLHEMAKSPEGEGIVLEDSIKRREEVGHALHIAEVLRIGIAGVGMLGCGWCVVFEVCEKHIFQLLQVDVRTGFVFLEERRCRVRMRDVLAGKEGDVSVGAVDVFLYRTDCKVSEMVSEEMFLGHIEA